MILQKNNVPVSMQMRGCNDEVDRKSNEMNKNFADKADDRGKSEIAALEGITAEVEDDLGEEATPEEIEAKVASFENNLMTSRSDTEKDLIALVEQLEKSNAELMAKVDALSKEAKSPSELTLSSLIKNDCVNAYNKIPPQTRQTIATTMSAFKNNAKQFCGALAYEATAIATAYKDFCKENSDFWTQTAESINRKSDVELSATATRDEKFDAMVKRFDFAEATANKAVDDAKAAVAKSHGIEKLINKATLYNAENHRDALLRSIDIRTGAVATVNRALDTVDRAVLTAKTQVSKFATTAKTGWGKVTNALTTAKSNIAAIVDNAKSAVAKSVSDAALSVAVAMDKYTREDIKQQLDDVAKAQGQGAGHNGPEDDV